MEVGFKNNGKINILKGHERAKEGTSRGDTATTLHNFSSHILLVRTENLEKPTLGRLGRKHDNYRAREPQQLF